MPKPQGTGFRGEKVQSSTPRRYGLRRAFQQEDSEEEANDEGSASDVDGGDQDAENPESAEQHTPSKRRRGRPKGYRKPRTPTPPRSLPPQEQYFFQNRPGGSIKTSNNTLSSVSLLSHEEYYEAMQKFRDPHDQEIQFLHEMHAHGYAKWDVELQEGFSVGLYGWGSKRRLLDGFAQYLSQEDEDEKEHAKIRRNQSRIIVVNGFNAGVSLRDVAVTMSSVIPHPSRQKLSSNPLDAVSTVLSALDEANASDKTRRRIVLMIHTLDSPHLRRAQSQSLIARVASHPLVSLVATLDTPNFPLLWDLRTRTTFNFLFHDVTTFAPFDQEMSTANKGGGVVDEVHLLLGRSSRKVHGKEGVVYVLRSLTESARRLYTLLIAECLSSAGLDAAHEARSAPLEGGQDARDGFEAAIAGNAPTRPANAHLPAESQPGIEYKSLYRKAVQELIATNEVQFRQLLKEFYDHEMVTSNGQGRGLGLETLRVPFRKEECEAILEDLMGEV